MNHELVFIGMEDDNGNPRMLYVCRHPGCALAASYTVDKRDVNNRVVRNEVHRKLASLILNNETLRNCPYTRFECGTPQK